MFGRGLVELQARAVLHPGLQRGGSGAGFVNGVGGSFTILAMGGIVNAAGASILSAGSRGTGDAVGGGGDGGRGSGGDGGSGGEVPAGSPVASRSAFGSSGQPGYPLQSLVDPTSLF